LGALVEPTAVAVHDVARAAVRPGEKAVVVGGGPVGLLIAAVARAAGADVLVLEVDEFRRSVIDGAGLSVADPLSTDAAALILDWTAGAGASVTFEVSGSQQGLDTAVDVLGVRGRMVLVGIHPTPKPLNLHRVFWRELTILGARVYERADFERAVELVSSGSVPARALISHVEPLGSAASAFEALEHGVGTMKVLIDCGAE
ncbi:MAG: zinc-binding dehydrogenase, partial [bacterium]|nr:zinc-binding dehydrogenase [bacterium]